MLTVSASGEFPPLDERSFFLFFFFFFQLLQFLLPIFARPFHRELYERASASWKRVLFTSDAENVYPGCMRLKGCMR